MKIRKLFYLFSVVVAILFVSCSGGEAILPTPEQTTLTVKIPTDSYLKGVSLNLTIYDCCYVGNVGPGSSVSQKVTVGSHYVSANTKDNSIACPTAMEPVTVPSGGLTVTLVCHKND